MFPPLLKRRDSNGEVAGLELGHVRGTHIYFQRTQAVETGVTQLWPVSATDGDHIGLVKWFGRWRKYAFFPNADTVYEETCMREIAEFCEELTIAHRIARKARKEKP